MHLKLTFAGFVAAILFISLLLTNGYTQKKLPFTNLQVLKVKNEKELATIMKSQAKDLGVRCDNCHNMDDFPSDDKPAKKTARIMLRLVADLNENYFNYEGAPKVTCYICHQGTLEPNPKRPE